MPIVSRKGELESSVGNMIPTLVERKTNPYCTRETAFLRTQSPTHSLRALDTWRSLNLQHLFQNSFSDTQSFHHPAVSSWSIGRNDGCWLQGLYHEFPPWWTPSWGHCPAWHWTHLHPWLYLHSSVLRCCLKEMALIHSRKILVVFHLGGGVFFWSDPPVPAVLLC